MVDARVNLTDYSNMILSVVKAKYSLRDKSEAINKYIEMHGHEDVEPEVKDSYVKKLLAIEEQHFKKYGYAKMSDKQLDALFGK